MNLMLHTKFWRHKKLLELAGDLKSDRKLVGTSIVIFWCWVLDNREDGNLGPMSCHDIAEVAEWSGDAQAFVDAQVSREFLHRLEDGSLQVHEWLEHQGRLVRQRVAARDRQREHRRQIKAKLTPEQAASVTRDVTVTRHDDPVTQAQDKPKTLPGSSNLSALVAVWNGHEGSGKIAIEKGIEHIRYAQARGAKLPDIETVIWDAKAAAGKTIWERLAHLTKTPDKNAPNRIQDLLATSQGTPGKKTDKSESEPERVGLRRMG